MDYGILGAIKSILTRPCFIHTSLTSFTANSVILIQINNYLSQFFIETNLWSQFILESDKN